VISACLCSPEDLLHKNVNCTYIFIKSSSKMPFLLKIATKKFAKILVKIFKKNSYGSFGPPAVRVRDKPRNITKTQRARQV
jgi:hypothetical protein